MMLFSQWLFWLKNMRFSTKSCKVFTVSLIHYDNHCRQLVEIIFQSSRWTHRNNSNMMFLVNSNLTLLHIIIWNKFAINVLLASHNSWSVPQKGNYFYTWQTSLPHPLKIISFPVHTVVPTWNFAGFCSGALVNARNKLGWKKVSRWEEMKFHIEPMNFALKRGNFWRNQQPNVTLVKLSGKNSVV